jgi:hypothetical protein
MSFLRFSEETAFIALKTINRLVIVIEMRHFVLNYGLNVQILLR